LTDIKTYNLKEYITLNDHTESQENGLSRRQALRGGLLLAAGAAAGLVATSAPGSLTSRSAFAATSATPPPIAPMTYGANDPIRSFYELLPQSASRRITIGIPGDSYVESADATSIEAGYPARLRDNLREIFPSGAAGGNDYVAARHQTAWKNEPKFQAFNFPVEVTRGSMHGWGRRNVPLTPEQGEGVRTAVFTSVKIAWWAPAAGAAIKIKIDNDAWVTVTADSLSERTWTSRQFPATEHTIRVAWAAGKPEFEGGWLFNGDENKGIHVIEGGNSGMSAWQVSKGAHPDGNSTWIDSAARFNFDLFMPEYLINDIVTRTPAQVQSDNTFLLKLIRTKSSAPILFSPPYERSTTTIAGTTWAQYIQALKNAAATDPLGKADVFDMSKYIPRLAGVGAAPDTYGWLGKYGHPTDAGYARMAEVLTAKLSAKRV
jgi:hypothetical protein